MLDYSNAAVVLEIDARLVVVRVGDRVPGAAAVLRHVAADHALFEFDADAQSPGGLAEIPRGSRVVLPTSFVEPLRATPAVSAEQVFRTSPSAAQKGN